MNELYRVFYTDKGRVVEIAPGRIRAHDVAGMLGIGVRCVQQIGLALAACQALPRSANYGHSTRSRLGPMLPMPRQNVRNLCRRAGIWWIRTTVAGHEIRESLRVRNIKAARKLRDARLEKFAQARAGLPQTSWKDAVAMWAEHVAGQIAPATAKRYAVSLLQCEPWLGKLPLSDIKTKTISDMARARKSGGASAATIRRDLTAVSRVLTHAEGQGLYEGNATLYQIPKRMTHKFISSWPGQAPAIQTLVSAILTRSLVKTSLLS
jgi:Phage integrase, N-terminal SAM-like domain